MLGIPVIVVSDANVFCLREQTPPRSLPQLRHSQSDNLRGVSLNFRHRSNPIFERIFSISLGTEFGSGGWKQPIKRNEFSNAERSTA